MHFSNPQLHHANEPLSKLIDQLNPEQKRAVLHEDGPLLVIAGAGSGKTKVATLRIAQLISKGVDPRSIVGVTFTNKASKEMKERVHALAGSSVLVSTFHSLGARILREFSHLIGYPSTFVIYDEDDKKKLMKTCLRRMLEKNSLFPALPIDDAIRAISNLKNGTAGALLPELHELFTLYQEELQKASAMDFDDLQFRALELLKNFPEVLQKLNSRWRYLLVDEYQDTNDVQSEISSLLAGKGMNIFAVGDPDQSIYSWRGANLDHILSFQERFPGAQVIRLEQNYRSTNAILSASNSVIQRNVRRLDKKLWSQRGEGEPLLCFVGRGEKQEAEYVIDGIQSLSGFGENKEALSNIAILYRTNAQSRSFEDELIRRHIPYVIWGGLSFYQRKEIKDVIAYCRLSRMPQEVIAFERVVNVPKRSIGGTTVEKLSHYASATDIPVLTLVNRLVSSQFDLSLFPGLSINFTAKQKQGLFQFSEVMEQLKQQAIQESAFQLVSSAIKDTGYLSYLETEEEEAFIDRRENLEQLLAKAMEWDQEVVKTEEAGSLDRFFEMMLLETAVQESLQGADRVTLATVHNAKGLEFETVFLVGLEEDLFPHINVKFKKDETSEVDIEEERRLMYVGMTRAKDRLSLSLSQSRMLWGGFRTMRPSRFLYEIPQEILKKVSSFPRKKNPSRPFIEKMEFEPRIEKAQIPASQKIPIAFEIGDIVLHGTYGIGKIIASADSSLGKSYEIRFSSDGMTRKMIASLAPLTKISQKRE